MKDPRARRPLMIAGIALIIGAGFAGGYALKAFHAQPTSAVVPPPAMNVAMNSAMNPGAAPVGAPSLGALLPGLEAKVAANPRDIDQRLLLAQTYNEVGQRDKGLATLRAVHKDAPDNTRATILLATSLMERDTPAELREAFTLLDDATRRRPDVAVMARLYQGEIRVKLGDAKGAQKIWREQLGKMPPDDPRRAMYEAKLAEGAPAR